MAKSLRHKRYLTLTNLETLGEQLAQFFVGFSLFGRGGEADLPCSVLRAFCNLTLSGSWNHLHGYQEAALFVQLPAEMFECEQRQLYPLPQRATNEPSAPATGSDWGNGRLRIRAIASAEGAWRQMSQSWPAG